MIFIWLSVLLIQPYYVFLLFWDVGVKIKTVEVR
jgi:hypothetical protein